MVAQRTLTPYVRVRILLPLPNKRKPGILVIPGFSCIYNGLRCFLRVRCTAHACMEKHARAHLSTHFYERICTRYEWCRQAPPAAHTCRQLAPRTTSGDTVRAEFGLGLESAQHPIGPTEEVAVLHRFAWLHILDEVVISCPVPNRCRLQ